MSIKNRLAILLAEKGWTFTKLAEESGITHAALSKLKNNQSTRIEFQTMEKLCRTLEVDVGDIWRYEAETANENGY